MVLDNLQAALDALLDGDGAQQGLPSPQEHRRPARAGRRRFRTHLRNGDRHGACRPRTTWGEVQDQLKQRADRYFPARHVRSSLSYADSAFSFDLDLETLATHHVVDLALNAADLQLGSILGFDLRTWSIWPPPRRSTSRPRPACMSASASI